MKLTKKIVRRRYLIQLIATCLVFLFIPFILLSSYIVSHSYNKLLHTSEEYFAKTTDSFSNYFLNEISGMRRQASRFSVESRDSKKNAFAFQLSRIKASPYNYIECISALSFYDEKNMGIYYRDVDCLFTGTSKYTVDTYIKYELQITDTRQSEIIRAFFDTTEPDAYVFFSSTYPEAGSHGVLLIGFPVKLGVGKEEALAFYILDDNAWDSFEFSSLGAYQAQFYILDQQSKEPVFYNSRSPLLAGYDFGRLPAGISYDTVGDTRYTIFLLEDDSLGNDYVAVVPFDQITDGVYLFYKTMRSVLIATFLIIFLSLGLMVYINYRPITRLLLKIGKSGTEGEFGAINDAFDRMSNEMNEQNMLIMDFLLNNILYGIPIPEKEFGRIGLKSHSGYFCVLAIYGSGLITEDHNALMDALHEKMGITAYITDLLYQNHSVMICLLESADNTRLVPLVENVLRSRDKRVDCVVAGVVVKSINDIHLSYKSCIQVEKAPKDAADKDRAAKISQEQMQEFRQSVIDYIQEHFADPSLSQTMAADHFGISVYSLSRMFKKQIGLGFSEFITGKRLEQAKLLLLTTDKSVGEIASDVGVPNITYFSRLFKSICGCSPSQFRKH